jgi:hypothetical protein
MITNNISLKTEPVIQKPQPRKVEKITAPYTAKFWTKGRVIDTYA